MRKSLSRLSSPVAAAYLLALSAALIAPASAEGLAQAVAADPPGRTDTG